MADLPHRRDWSKFLLISASSACDVAEMLRQMRREPTFRAAKDHKISRHHPCPHKMEILFARSLLYGGHVRAVLDDLSSPNPSSILDEWSFSHCPFIICLMEICVLLRVHPPRSTCQS